MKVEIYTDGSAKGNPGRGGYGVLMRFKGNIREISEGFRMTTNNRMELLAVIVALESLKSDQYPIHVYSDSKYVVDSISKGWIFNWQRSGFKGKKNKDLWQRYLKLHPKYNLVFHWVKGHAGHPDNERNHLLIDQAFENQREDNGLL
jgi:ribonuclease HI